MIATLPSASPATETSGSPTMRTVVQDRYGVDPAAVLRLADGARPEPAAGEVLVRVVAAGVDRGTVHLTTGRPYAMRLMGFGFRGPKATSPGRAFAGVVESVGAGVSGFAIGDEVYGSCSGSFAELVVAEAGMVARKPANLTFEQAAAVPISAATAFQAVERSGVRAGQRVLILGGSGGVGTYAVQIAAAAGAEVTGVCSGAKAELVRGLGADRVLDYRRDEIGAAGERYDVILDIGGNRRLRDLRRLLTPEGTLLIVGGETDGRWLGGFDRSLRAMLWSPFVRQRLSMLVSTEEARVLDELRDLIESGQVTPVLDRTFGLEAVAEAIRYVGEGRAAGKVVVVV